MLALATANARPTTKNKVLSDIFVGSLLAIAMAQSSWRPPFYTDDAVRDNANPVDVSDDDVIWRRQWGDMLSDVKKVFFELEKASLISCTHSAYTDYVNLLKLFVFLFKEGTHLKRQDGPSLWANKAK